MSAQVEQLVDAITRMVVKHATANRNYAYAVSDMAPTERALRACERRAAVIERLVNALAHLADERQTPAILRLPPTDPATLSPGMRAAWDMATAPLDLDDDPTHLWATRAVDRIERNEGARPGYDAHPTILLAPGQTYADWYERYAAHLDEVRPGWHHDDPTRMAGELADLARIRNETGETR